MTASLLLSWREGVVCEAEGAGLHVRGPRGVLVLRHLAPALSAALDQLQPCGADEECLAEQVLKSSGVGVLAKWYYTLQRLARCGFLCRTLQRDGRRLATLLPISPGFTLAPSTVISDREYLLSRFAYFHRDGAAMALESPLAHARVIFDNDRALAAAGMLVKPLAARELAERGGFLSVEAAVLLLGLLAGAGMIQAAGSDGDPESPRLASWEFHDLLFHTRSRKGRCDAPFGATYRLADRLKPPPAVKTIAAAENYELYRPDLQQLRRDDPPLTEVMERRRSLRDYDGSPVTARQLGEFLYRVARLKDSRELELAIPSGPLQMEFVSRPYPSGGALYELEFYVAVHACDGLAAGLYHYDGRRHCLSRLRPRAEAVQQLLSDAAASAGIVAERLQVLLVVAARFQRLAWKYASIAYALILKHVGVVYQTMYLTATAMDLAPCALGGGDADVFARAAGTDYYEETSVGEFLLGSAKSSCEESIVP